MTMTNMKLNDRVLIIGLVNNCGGTGRVIAIGTSNVRVKSGEFDAWFAKTSVKVIQ